MNQRDFKVGEWYETVNSDELWDLWECKEETGTWFKKKRKSTCRKISIVKNISNK